MGEAHFDEIIHAPWRLRICGLLNRVDQLDFAVLRDTLSLSDSALSKQIKTLEEVGYVASRKAASTNRDDARRLTWLSLTKQGRAAFEAHIRALQEIASSDAGHL
ncbi:MAG: transcriptional regulator [Propionibacteriaceae bacterium]|jgi:DNA-binding MarR family transcriptional regulator|nr:transcriptional regulator [Propionibacteriaceae bacterium]